MLELCVYVLGACELRLMFWDSNFHFVKNFFLFTLNLINDWNISSSGIFNRWSMEFRNGADLELKLKIGKRGWKRIMPVKILVAKFTLKICVFQVYNWTLNRNEQSNQSLWSWAIPIDRSSIRIIRLGKLTNIQLPHYYGARSNLSPFLKKWQKRGVSSTDFSILLLSC